MRMTGTRILHCLLLIAGLVAVAPAWAQTQAGIVVFALPQERLRTMTV